jgi:hypothetical protein
MAPRTGTTGARRFGYAVGALVNLAIAWAVNVWPGWEAVPFLTEETSEVIPLVNLSLLVGVLTNVVYMVLDPPWLKALGGLASTAISLAVATRTFTVFPFDFGADASLWEPLTEGFLIFLIVALVLALLVQGVSFIKLLVVGPRRPDEEEVDAA